MAEIGEAKAMATLKCNPCKILSAKCDSKKKNVVCILDAFFPNPDPRDPKKENLRKFGAVYGAKLLKLMFSYIYLKFGIDGVKFWIVNRFRDLDELRALVDGSEMDFYWQLRGMEDILLDLDLYSDCQVRDIFNVVSNITKDDLETLRREANNDGVPKKQGNGKNIGSSHDTSNDDVRGFCEQSVEDTPKDSVPEVKNKGSLIKVNNKGDGCFKDSLLKVNDKGGVLEVNTNVVGSSKEANDGVPKKQGNGKNIGGNDADSKKQGNEKNIESNDADSKKQGNGKNIGSAKISSSFDWSSLVNSFWEQSVEDTSNDTSNDSMAQVKNRGSLLKGNNKGVEVNNKGGVLEVNSKGVGSSQEKVNNKGVSVMSIDASPKLDDRGPKLKGNKGVVLMVNDRADKGNGFSRVNNKGVPVMMIDNKADKCAGSSKGDVNKGVPVVVIDAVAELNSKGPEFKKGPEKNKDMGLNKGPKLKDRDKGPERKDTGPERKDTGPELRPRNKKLFRKPRACQQVDVGIVDNVDINAPFPFMLDEIKKK